MFYLVAIAIENGQFMTDKGQITNNYAEIYEDYRKADALKYAKESLKALINGFKSMQEHHAGSTILLVATIESEEAEEISELLFRAEIRESGAIGLGGETSLINDLIPLIREEAIKNDLAILDRPYNYEQEKDLTRLTKPYEYDA